MSAGMLRVHVLDDSYSVFLEHLRQQLEDSVCLTAGPVDAGAPLFEVLVAGRPDRKALDHSPELKRLVIPFAGLPEETRTDKHKRGGRGSEKGTGYVRARPAKWQTMVPLRIRAMLLAGDRLFAAGMPDVVDEKDPLASFEGRLGATLQVYSAADGSPLESHPLTSLPAFDGLSAARGRLYLTTLDGKVICFGAPTAE